MTPSDSTITLDLVSSADSDKAQSEVSCDWYFWRSFAWQGH
jgi:hypothetical protein